MWKLLLQHQEDLMTWSAEELFVLIPSPLLSWMKLTECWTWDLSLKSGIFFELKLAIIDDFCLLDHGGVCVHKKEIIFVAK